MRYAGGGPSLAVKANSQHNNRVNTSDFEGAENGVPVVFARRGVDVFQDFELFDFPCEAELMDLFR
jgi:hypothetical protein